MRLLRLALFQITACCMFGLVTSKVLNTDVKCYKRFGGVNLMPWIVRIMTDVSGGGKRDIATGNIITERYVLTACFPFIYTMRTGTWSRIWVVPTVNDYSRKKPDKDLGIFPYQSNSSACSVAWFQVQGWESVTEGNLPCKESITDYPDKMKNNLVLLRLSDKIMVADDKLFPRMAFDFDVEHIARQIDWLNRFRRARCIIPRWKIIDATYRSVVVIPPFFDLRGFHYKSWPFKTQCAPTVCRISCREKTNDEGEREYCNRQCVENMDRELGTLMCLIRMDEQQQDEEDSLYSLLYDAEDKHREYNRFFNDKDCQFSGQHRILGSPVIYNGEVIAIVTKCDKDFIMATSIVAVRHQILKRFDVSYLKDIDFLSKDPDEDE